MKFALLTILALFASTSLAEGVTQILSKTLTEECVVSIDRSPFCQEIERFKTQDGAIYVYHVIYDCKVSYQVQDTYRLVFLLESGETRTTSFTEIQGKSHHESVDNKSYGGFGSGFSDIGYLALSQEGVQALMRYACH